MNKKICISCVGAAILLILSCFPPVVASIVNNDGCLKINAYRSKQISKQSDTVEYAIYHIKEDKTYEKEIKVLTVEKSKAMWAELKSTEHKDLTLNEIFEEKLEIMKNYGIVSSEITLNEFVDVEKLKQGYKSMQSQDFQAASAPIMFVGGGFGLGFGVPFFITSGTFLMILFGFGLVMCYDTVNTVLNQLFTMFFIPMLIGYLGGFTGLLLLPVIPGFFYSNAVGLGMVALTSWKLVPSGK